VSAPLADLTGPGSEDDAIFADGFEGGDAGAWSDDDSAT